MHGKYFEFIFFAVYDDSGYMLIHKYEYCGQQRGYDGRNAQPQLVWVPGDRIYEPASRRYSCLR